MPDVPEPKNHPHPGAHASDMAVGALKRHGGPAAAYAELAITTNFTFLTGASHPEEVVEQAADLGHRAVAVADTNTLAGIVRAHIAAERVGIPLVVGCRLALRWRCGPGPDAGTDLEVLVYPVDRAAYGRLCRLLTLGKRRAPKGTCDLNVHDLIEHAEGLLAVVVPPAMLDEDFIDLLAGLGTVFDDDRLSLGAARLYGSDDAPYLDQLTTLGAHVGVPLVAMNAVHYHRPQRRPLQDVLTCIRLGCTLDEAGLDLFANAERHLKPPEEMARLFADCPGALARGVAIAERAAGFNLDQLRYAYPHEVCPPGVTPIRHLIDLTWQGAAGRYPGGVPAKVQRQLEHEFGLIDELQYAPYFLTVHDLVAFARARGILCQGRGAAANSAVCYCLGVTSVDPDRIDVLFERFVSRQRNEPPDIDIDFEHERREEVIQYIYRKYGRDRAALTAEVITYRRRSAVRDVGKALGLSLDCVDRLARDVDWWDEGGFNPQRLRELGLNPADPTVRRLGHLVGQILGFPRHLSQHVGGFVITRMPLCELVPIENAAMPDRTVIEWDKDDIDALGILKVDVLGLGMLTCIRKVLEMVEGEGEATERRSDEATKGGEGEGTGTERDEGLLHHEGDWNGKGQDISRSDCVAEGDGPGTGDVSLHGANAGLGAIWPDAPDAPGGGVDSVQHRRRACPPEPGRLPQAPSDSESFTGGAVHPVRTGGPPHHAHAQPDHDGPAGRGRSHPPGPDPQPGAEDGIGNDLPPPSSLRRFVASSLSLSSIPPEDPAVYDMICRADTLGVFQIESRAQMSMLPRLRPRCFYDLVIEVAIVRPGPIQGNMVHPYLRRRNGEETVTYPSEAVRHVLAKTLGVPLFQEQAMQLAIVAAGFSPEEADQLRRAIAAWKSRKSAVMDFGQRLIDGMLARGYPRDFAERCFEQIKGFSEYGFPESHAASFALLVYVSAWLKCHHPAAFATGLLNSQPMGFYAPAQIVRDAREHGVEVRSIDVNHSGWDCVMERGSDRGEVAVRLGMRLVKGMRRVEAEAIAAAVARAGSFGSVAALWRASGVRVAALRRLAAADAFGSMGLGRQAALWQVRALHDEDLPMFEPSTNDDTEGAEALPEVTELQMVARDYTTLGLSLRKHPLAFIRDGLATRGAITAADLKDEGHWPHGTAVAVAGVVLVRQRPSTASGIVFMTLEDETGVSNLIVRPHIFKRDRSAARHGVVLLVNGRIERSGEVVHVVAQRIEDIGHEITRLTAPSRDFH